MPELSAADFWTALARTGLIERGTIEAVRREHAAAPAACGGGTAQGIAGWLVGRDLLTRWQAKRLAVGNSGPFFLADYRLLERHDRAGDALLFTARHDPSGRIVSVVLLNAKRCRRIDVWTEIVRRTKAASQTTDPMLSRTWSLERHEGGRLLVCEHIGGTSLAKELDEHGPLPAVQAGVLVSQIARAVAELHRLGTVHGGLALDALRREPPPGGVPRTGRVRLLQFPLAGDPHRVPLRPWNDAAELAALGKGTGFVAPELALPGSVCDPRSDVYAIGAILYALLSGSLPCVANTPEETLRRAITDGPRPLGPPAVTTELATLVGYLMARDPAERYATAAEAADAIAGCLGLAGGSGGVPPRPAVAAVVRPAAAAGPVVKASAVAPAERLARGSGASLVRQRAARLRLIGGAITLAILAGTAALVVSRFKASPRVASRLDVESEGSEPQPAMRSEPAPEDGVGWGEAPSPRQPPPAVREQGDEPRSDGSGQVEAAPEAAARQTVVDDPTLPWASPTEGPPPNLAYLPPGSQLMLLARPADLAADEEGALVLKALGPEVEAGLDQLATWCGCEPAEIEFVQAGWQAGGGEEVLGGYAVRLVEGRTVPADRATQTRAWGATTASTVEGETIHRGDRFGFWIPSTEAGRVLVITTEGGGSSAAGGTGPAGQGDSLLAQVVRQAVSMRGVSADALQAELPREFEELVSLLDVERHLTLFGVPHYLQVQGRPLLSGPLARLVEPLDDLFGDAVKAAGLSAHFADSCYLELDAVTTVDVPAKEMAVRLAAHVEGLTDTVERYCAGLAAAPYGRVLVMRLPQMLRLLVANMRSGAEGKGVVLNAYLPRRAGHNLALATEIALAQQPGAGAAAAAPVPTVPAATDALGKLEQKITLVFAKDTLEKSIQMVSEEIGVPMDILGPDLQLEGITKNQSFGLEARDLSAREVLLEILAKANPDGKLVYVVATQDGEEAILITTRAAVAKRGDTLPPGLEAPPAAKKKP